MAKADVIDFLKPWTQSGQEAQDLMSKQLDQGLDIIRENRGGIFPKLKKGKTISTLKKRWMEQVSYATRITGTLTTSTITFSGYLMQSAISEASMRGHIKGGTILMRPSDGLQVVVSRSDGDIDYSAFTAVVAAHGNSGSLSNDTSATTWLILGHATSDYDDTWAPSAVTRGFRFVGHQIWKQMYEQPWTKKSIAMENVADEAMHQVKEHFEYLYNMIARSALSMRPVHSGGAYVTGFETETPTMTGLFQYPNLLNEEYPNANVFVNKSSTGTAEEIDPEDLNGVIQSLEEDEEADFNVGDWVIACSLTQHRFISDFYENDRRFGMTDEKVGKRVATFKSAVGKEFPIVADQYMVSSEIVIVDLSGAEWGYLNKDQPRVVILGQDASRVDKKMLTCGTWGVQLRKPRQRIAKIYGLPSSYS
jgi:hypothetical protein